MWRKREKLTADSFDDPLARRIFVRSQREHRRRKWKDGVWDALCAAARANVRAAPALVVVFLLSVLWAVVSSLYEEIAAVIHRRNQQKRRRRRGTRTKVRTHFREV